MKKLALVFVGVTVCMPPSVHAVEDFLVAYKDGDGDMMVANTWSGDQEAVLAGIQAMEHSPTRTAAIIMPPRPLKHEIQEIESKEAGRQVILTKLTLNNPLASVSKKVGHVLPDMPKTRTKRHRFLSVQEGERWGVKFDLGVRRKR